MAAVTNGGSGDSDVRVTTTAYVPTVRIIHYGGGAARKGWRHIDSFVRSGMRFYRKHGWKWF